MTAPALRPRIEIVVDELLLRGVDPEQAHVVAAALQTRLAALGETWAGGGGASPSGREEVFLRLPAVRAPAGSPGALGSAVAEAVWEGVADVSTASSRGQERRP